jgi:hypothetical protein
MDDHGKMIRNRKQRTDIGKYCFVNRAIKDWKLIPVGILAYFPYDFSTFRKRVKEAVTSKYALRQN